jgi:DNA-binding response OmpR family regulator
MFWTRRKHIDELRSPMPREELIRRSRVLFVDDERPTLIDDLKAAHFSAEHVADIDNNNLDLIDRKLYDLILLDFGNVGKAFGRDEGLALLRHIKRVNPATVVLAYTAKALAADHSDFYRLADGVLAKDAGIADSLEKVASA